MDLLSEYKQTLKETKRLLDHATVEDIKILKDIISDLEYSIEWLSTGRRPGNKRGIERRAAYQRERPFDPLLMQRYFRCTEEDIYEWDEHQQEDSIGTWDKLRIEDALSVLSEKEKEIYLMSRGNSLSYYEIAKLLDISKSTVQDTIKRSEKKISKQIKESLFCLSS